MIKTIIYNLLTAWNYDSGWCYLNSDELITSTNHLLFFNYIKGTESLITHGIELKYESKDEINIEYETI